MTPEPPRAFGPFTPNSSNASTSISIELPIFNQFWGDRYGKVKDPFGHEWSLATHIRDMSPAEMEAAMKAAGDAGKPGS